MVAFSCFSTMDSTSRSSDKYGLLPLDHSVVSMLPSWNSPANGVIAWEVENMNIVSWAPFREMDDMFSRYHRWPRRMAASGDDRESAMMMDWRPVANITESAKEYVIKAELPEVDRKDVHVSVDGGAVIIRGERKMDKEEEDAKQHRVESFYGTFSRSFVLPENADASDISAVSKDGVLKVRIPKMEEIQPKKIEVDIK